VVQCRILEKVLSCSIRCSPAQNIALLYCVVWRGIVWCSTELACVVPSVLVFLHSNWDVRHSVRSPQPSYIALYSTLIYTHFLLFFSLNRFLCRRIRDRGDVRKCNLRIQVRKEIRKLTLYADTIIGTPILSILTLILSIRPYPLHLICLLFSIHSLLPPPLFLPFPSCLSQIFEKP
jgi:hypothetical protein